MARGKIHPHPNVAMPSPEKFDDEYDDAGLEEEMAKKNATRSLANKIGTGVGLGSLGTNAAVIILLFILTQTIGYVSLVASCVAILVALIVIKRQIIDMAPTHTLRFIHNKLRRKVHHLFLANNQLKEHVDQLQKQVTELGDCENQLSKISKEQGTNVDQLVKLVKENGEITEQMARAIEASATMQLMDLALDCDRDESNLFSEQEIESLLMRLSGVEGIVVNEPVLRTQLQQDNSLHSVLAMLNYSHAYAKKHTTMGKGAPQKVSKEEAVPVFTFELPQ